MSSFPAIRQPAWHELAVACYDSNISQSKDSVKGCHGCSQEATLIPLRRATTNEVVEVSDIDLPSVYYMKALYADYLVHMVLLNQQSMTERGDAHIKWRYFSLKSLICTRMYPFLLFVVLNSLGIVGLVVWNHCGGDIYFLLPHGACVNVFVCERE